MKSTKRMQIIRKKLNEKTIYTIQDGITLLKKLSKTNFIESVDASINLGINPKKSDQNVRGLTILPHGIGRTIRIAVFTQGENVEIAKNLNVEFIGMDDLAEKIINKSIKFDIDIVIASPDAMKIVGKIGPYLGPRGLMPNPKLGTVTPNIEQAIIRAKNGQIRYRNDKNGIIHATIGKINFQIEKLKDNLTTFLNAIKKSKPPQSKGTYIKKIMLSTTMGGAVNINPNTLE